MSAPRLESDYPYIERESGKCRIKSTKGATYKLASLHINQPYEIDDIKESLNRGVVIANIAIDSKSFIFYK